MRLGVAAALVGGRRLPGDVLVEDRRVTRVGMAPRGSSGLAIPGFVDLQVNGFAGVDVLGADGDAYRRMGQALAATGVTAYQPTIISSPLDAYGPALARVIDAGPTPGGPRLLGVHLEGPFLSRKWCGAHSPASIIDPDLDATSRLLDAGPVTYMTVAPERPRALALIELLVKRGITVSVGHTDADAPRAHAAFDAGARSITHIYNAQRRFQPRDPGVAGAALARQDVVVQAIVDGVHLAPETVFATYLAARGRFAMVTDATAAAGLGDGIYSMADRTVTVRGGEARLDDGTLAGSTLTMDRAVRNLVALGAPLEDAVAASSEVPARLVGRGDLGAIRPDMPADITVLDDRLEVVRTLVDGTEIFAN